MLVFPSNPNAGDIFAPGPGLPSWIWDGDKWTRGGAATFALEALADVAISDPAQGEMLTWDATAEKWVNAPVPEVNLTSYATQQYVHDQIAAIPAPPTPSLMGLSDTSLANLAAGQALTYSGSAWVNSNIFAGPVRALADGSSSSNAFAVTNAAQTANYFWVRGDGANYLRSPVTCQDPFGGPIWETLPVAGRAALQMYASQNGPGITISQNTPNSSTGADWLLKVIGNTDSPSGTSFGMYMRAGNSFNAGGGDTAFQVSNIQGENIFQLNGSGSMNMGPPYGLSSGWIRAPLILDWMGNMTLGLASGQATNPARCYMQARDGQIALITMNSGAEWSAQISNSNSAGSSFGLYVLAGLTANDHSLNVATRTGGTSFLVRGDGNVQVARASVSAYATGAIDTAGWIYRATSLRQYKTNIHDITLERARNVVRGLRAVQFNSLCEVDDPRRDCYGLIAEEVEEIDPTLVQHAADGKPASVMYDRVAMLLLPLMQEILEKEQPC